ncbi:hypothetical protein D3C80_785280 [compost metagenome]
MQGQVDAVIADPPLRIVVGADALGPVAGTDLRLARVGTGRVLHLALHVVKAHPQILHRLVAVDVLRLLRRGHDDPGREVGDAHRRVGLVDVLAARARGPEGVDADVLVVDLDLHVLDLGQDRDGGRRGVDAPLGLGRRNPLDAVNAAFELQPPEHALAGDGGDDFLVAAGFALGGAVDLDPPAARGGVARIHAEQVAGEDGRLVPAGAGAHFQHGRGVFVSIARGQQQGDLAFQLGQTRVQGLQFVGGHGGHFRVRGHGLQVLDLGASASQGLHRVGHGLHLGVLLRQTHDLGAVRRRAHAGLHLMEAVEHLIEPGLGQSQGSVLRRKNRARSLTRRTAPCR